MRNSIQKFLNLPFSQRELPNNNEAVLKLEDGSNIVKNEVLKLNYFTSDNTEDVIFEVKPYWTSFYFLNEQNFIYEKYNFEIDEEDEEEIPLHVIKELKDKPNYERNSIKKVKFKNSKYVTTIPFSKDCFETIILSNEEDDKIFFITRNTKTSVCNKIVSLDINEISSITYIQKRKDIWDNGFLSLFAALEIFGDDEVYNNIPFLEQFYEGLCVTDTLTL